MCSLWHFQNLKPKFSGTLSVTSYIWTIRCWSQNWRGFYFPFPRRRYCNAESVERAQRKKAETLDDKTHYMALCDGAVFLFYNFDISSLLLEVCLCCWLQSLISEIQKTDNVEKCNKEIYENRISNFTVGQKIKKSQGKKTREIK